MKKKHSTSSLKASIIAFHLLIVIAFLALLFLFIHPNEFRLQSLVASDCESQHRSAHLIDAVNPRPALRVLIGILTTPKTYERRHLLRTVYALQQRNLTVDARIDIFFVFCNLTKEEQRVLIALEILRYDDVVILQNCSESLNGGKTYGYFSSLPTIFGGEDEEDKPYDYAMKAGDDTYLRLGELVATIAAAPREDLYLRLYVPCGNLSDPDGLMTGMAYALSWDVVEWIVESEIPRRNKVHRPLGEDVVLAHWLRDGKRGRNRIDMGSRTYIFEKHPPCYSKPLVPDTVAVHGLKDHAAWAKTLAFFNVTQGLEPSAFYHID